MLIQLEGKDVMSCMDAYSKRPPLVNIQFRSMALRYNFSVEVLTTLGMIDFILTGFYIPEELIAVCQNDLLLLQTAVQRTDSSITSNTYRSHNYQSMVLKCTNLTKQQDEMFDLFSN
jgi:hypothetical protein